MQHVLTDSKVKSLYYSLDYSMCNMVSQTARLKAYSLDYSMCNMFSQTARLKEHVLTDSKVEI